MQEHKVQESMWKLQLEFIGSNMFWVEWWKGIPNMPFVNFTEIKWTSIIEIVVLNSARVQIPTLSSPLFDRETIAMHFSRSLPNTLSMSTALVLRIKWVLTRSLAEKQNQTNSNCDSHVRCFVLFRSLKQTWHLCFVKWSPFKMCLHFVPWHFEWAWSMLVSWTCETMYLHKLNTVPSELIPCWGLRPQGTFKNVLACTSWHVAHDTVCCQLRAWIMPSMAGLVGVNLFRDHVLVYKFIVASHCVKRRFRVVSILNLVGPSYYYNTNATYVHSQAKLIS